MFRFFTTILSFIWFYASDSYIWIFKESVMYYYEYASELNDEK